MKYKANFGMGGHHNSGQGFKLLKLQNSTMFGSIFTIKRPYNGKDQYGIKIC